MLFRSQGQDGASQPFLVRNAPIRTPRLRGGRNAPIRIIVRRGFTVPIQVEELRTEALLHVAQKVLPRRRTLARGRIEGDVSVTDLVSERHEAVPGRAPPGFEDDRPPLQSPELPKEIMNLPPVFGASENPIVRDVAAEPIGMCAQKIDPPLQGSGRSLDRKSVV